MAPPFVNASVKSPKHETRDAEAICAAVPRPTRRVAPIKQLEPRDLQALHRVRERLVKARTALVSEIRGLLSEFGMILPQGLGKFRPCPPRALDGRQASLA